MEGACQPPRYHPVGMVMQRLEHRPIAKGDLPLQLQLALQVLSRSVVIADQPFMMVAQSPPRHLAVMATQRLVHHEVAVSKQYSLQHPVLMADQLLSRHPLVTTLHLLLLLLRLHHLMVMTDQLLFRHPVVMAMERHREVTLRQLLRLSLTFRRRKAIICTTAPCP